MKKVSFHILNCKEGQILYRVDHGFLEVWSVSDECDSIMWYQFGCNCTSLDDAELLISSNLNSGNILWFPDVSKIDLN